MNDYWTTFLTPDSKDALASIMREQDMDEDLAIGLALQFYAAAMPHKPIDAALAQRAAIAAAVDAKRRREDGYDA